MLLRHLYIVAAVGVTSALINEVKRETKSSTFYQISLQDAINNSMSIKIGERSHNVASISKRSTLCDVTYINFVVCRLGLASQGVTF
jgi:hypothetical protein